MSDDDRLFDGAEAEEVRKLTSGLLHPGYSGGKLSLPWTAEFVENDWYLSDGAFPWLVLDCWGVVIARFDTEAQTRAVVSAMNAIHDDPPWSKYQGTLW